MERIIDVFKAHNGYARMKELKAVGINTRYVKMLLENGTIEKLKPGLYKLSGFSNEIISTFVDVCQMIPKGVVCLISALDYYDLTTFSPKEIYVAIPNETKKVSVDHPPVKFFYFTKNMYSLGLKNISTEFGEIKIYNREKTVCDMFRFRNRLGEDLAIEALKNYLELNKGNLITLQEYMHATRMERIMAPYIKSMVHV